MRIRGANGSKRLAKYLNAAGLQNSVLKVEGKGRSKEV